ncbi:vitellogenin-like [Diorhabda sublineata]|uniref:vitellogenin-like n=1 Tax=Diorhabda sublineata TaxID=1163346 RepID=UPI0024E152B0|nr:vitellogenin-like [Diorhabda sublineata]
MWSQYIFLLLVGCITTATTSAWIDNREYVYSVQGRTLASLDIANVFSGILMRTTLRIQTRPDGNLQGLLVNPQYAQIHSELSEGPLTHIPSAEVNWKQLEMSRKPFQIVMNRGVISDLVVTRSMPNWEANILKGIISQLQLNIDHWGTADPDSFIIPEETVSGTTDTSYKINRIPEYLLLNSEIVPDFQSIEEDDCDILEVVKHKNYTNSIELPSFIYGLGNVFGKKAASNVMGEFFVRDTMTRALVTRCSKQSTIQNTFTLNKVSVSPTFSDNQQGSVVSMWNATLEQIKLQNKVLEDVIDPIRLGGLVYSYGNSHSHSNKVEEKQREYNYFEYKEVPWKRTVKSISHYSDSTWRSAETYKQEKPDLNKPTEYPMLPYTIGNKGFSIKNDIDIVQSVVSIAQEIGSDLQDPRKTLAENTLAKFINLIKLVRTMDQQELKRAGNDLYYTNNEDLSRYAAWATYRDVVAESGSLQSLLVIQSWIESRNLKLMEAAYVIAQMMNSVQTPTTEYIKTLFEFVKKPVVSSQWPLNETAILSLSELTRKVFFDDAFYKTNYPIESYKNLRDEQGREYVRKTIIPYFTKCLDSAIIQDEPTKIHTYIRALGFIGDTEILKAFEPYLEGKKMCSQYQRTLMVIAMDKLVKTYPDIARDVLYRIYENSGEYQPLRVAAVYQLMRTKPSVEMLQLMASYTNVDVQEEVNAAVKTSIQSFASLKLDEFKDLRYAAEMALPLLTETEYGLHQGGNYLRTYIVDQLNLKYKETLQLYGSSDNFIPKGFKYAWRSNEGGRRNQILNIQTWLTSVDQLSRVIYEQTESFHLAKQQQNLKRQQNVTLSSQNIARILNMQAQADEQLEGIMFFMDAVLPLKMLTFDNNTIEQLPHLLKQLEKYLNEDKEINEVKLTNSDDAIMALPLEMGIPFVFMYDAPTVLKVHGKVKAAVQPNLSECGRFQKPTFIKIRTDMAVTFGSKIQGHISFFTPFDRREYYSGFEKTMQLHLPIAGTFEVNLEKKELSFDIEPKEIHNEAPLFHYSTWPFTSWRDITDLRTLVAQHHNQYIKSDRIRTFNTVVGKQQTGLSYRIKFEHNRDTIQMSDIYMFWQKGNLDAINNLWRNGDIQYSQFNFTYLPKESLTKNVQLRLRYYQDYKEKGETHSFNWNYVSSADNYSERINTLLKGARADIRNVESRAIDASMRFIGSKNIEHIVSGAVSKSNVDPKSRIFAFYKLKKSDFGKPYEMKLEAVNDIPNTNTLNVDYALAAEPKVNSLLILTFDTDNGEKGQIKADIMLTRSGKRKEFLKDLPMYQQCKRDMRVNNNQSPACVNMTLAAQLLNKIDINLAYDNLSPLVKDIVETAYDHLKYNYYPSVETDYVQKSEAGNQIKIKSQFDEDLQFLNISVTTKEQTTNFKDIEAGEYSRSLFVVNPAYSLSSRIISKILEIDTINPVCVADQSQVTTFSNLTYPSVLSNYWTVLAQYVPIRANEEEEIYSVHEQLESQETNLVILARKSMSASESETAKDVKIVISSPDTDFETIEILMSLNQKRSSVDIYVNGQQREVSEFDCHDIRNGYIQIFALSHGEVKMEVKNILHLTYDGIRIKLEAVSSLLRGSTRGLCGSFSDQQNEDFLTPSNCYARNHEKFIRSYEVEGQQGEQTREELSQDSHLCVEKKMPLHINIISLKDLLPAVDVEQSEGNNCTRHQTRYFEQSTEICFTTSVVPTCSSVCQAEGYITKTIPVHCIVKSNVALLWKKQIDTGGNPDFSHKKEHKKLQMEVPQTCSK